jgi:hypothetical protein
VWVRMPGAERLPGFFYGIKIATRQCEPAARRLRSATFKAHAILKEPSRTRGGLWPPITPLNRFSERVTPTAVRERLLDRRADAFRHAAGLGLIE